MKFKNKETGVVWDIVDETHIKRCENDSNYEKVVEKKKSEKKEEKTTSNTTAKKKSTKSKTSK